MSLQVFFQGQFQGVAPFLSGAAADSDFVSRSLWIALLTEITPKAFLAARGLSPLLAGFAGGGRFLLVTPEQETDAAEAHFAGVRDAVRTATGGVLEFHWARTENLGEWPHAAKRLRDGLRQSCNTPLAAWGDSAFRDVGTPTGPAPWEGLSDRLAATGEAGWNAASPGSVSPDEPQHRWPLTSFGLAVETVTTKELARRANGRRAWGVLRCDVDRSRARLNQTGASEEYLFLSVLYKGLVAGELRRILELPAHQHRVTVLYSGGDDFAVAGAWDALLSVAVEFQRVFALFAAELPGGTGSGGDTISAAMTLAGPAEPVASVWTRNAEALDAVKSSGGNAFSLFDRVLDWPAWKEAVSLKTRIRKLRDQHRCPPEVFAELSDFYAERGAADQLASLRSRRRERAVDRPWRFQRRLRRLAGDRTGSDFERQWRAFLGELMGRGSAQSRQLRPAGKVALDWANLETAGNGARASESEK